MNNSRRLATLLFSLVLASAGLPGCGGDGPTLVYRPDGSGGGVVPDAQVNDVSQSGDATTGDASIPPNDATAGADGSSDIPSEDDSLAPPADTGEPVPEAFFVVSAFSSDGATVTVRFSHDVDLATGQDAGNFDFLEGTTPLDAIVGASVDGPFVKLALRPGTDIDPDYTYKIHVRDVLSDERIPLDPARSQATVRRTVYLAIVWHQHQPLYLDALQDELQGPWVRKHATKDYYDMAAMVADYPEVHFTINLTIVMLNQLQRYYVDRLGPYVDTVANRVDEEAFLARWAGKTDPWIDLLLEDTPTPEEATDTQLDLLYAGPWSCVSTHPSVIARFPQYEAVRYKNPAELTQDDFRTLKVMFEVAWFDPDFLDHRVDLPDGTFVDMTDIIRKEGDNYIVKVPITEELANRLVAEEFKIMANVVPIHQQLRYSPERHTGQIEIATTPYYHPILPLIYDTDQVSIASPGISKPDPPFSYPEDARAQVLRAIGFYERLFGEPPRGMWPGEGSVAEAVVPIFVSEGIHLTWVGTGEGVLKNSTPRDQPTYFPYRVDGDTEMGDGGASDDEMIVVFRDEALSDKIGFKFQTYQPSPAADELIRDILDRAPRFGAPDRLVTIILDGENAWENYTQDHDGKGFLRALYSRLDRSAREGEIVSVTPTEYVTGNPRRGLPPHPVHDQPELEPLWAGSWIAANFEVWIGEGEENKAWEYLAQARADLGLSGLTPPNPRHGEPDPEADEILWNTWKAFDEIYAAEGSDWFWWYGDDMVSPSNDDSPFDVGFRSHLDGMYSFMNAALTLNGEDPMPAPDFPPIIQEKPRFPEGPYTAPPTIDGQLVPDRSEWLDEGGSFSDRDSSVMHTPNDDITDIYYGYSTDNLYVAITTLEDFVEKEGAAYDVSLYFTQRHVLDAEQGTVSEEPGNPTTLGGYPFEFKDGAGATGGATWRLMLDFSAASVTPQLMKADGAGGWSEVASGVVLGGPVAPGKVLELRIPLDDLMIEFGDPLEFMAVATEDGEEIDYAPNFGAYQIFEDATSLVYVTWEVDVTGSQSPIDAYGEICTPPAAGGIVYIAGNVRDLGLRGEDWWPNKVALVDTGEGPDRVAADGIWTIRKQLARGQQLKWKYTIGRPDDEGHWHCTEEYPISFRGFALPNNPNLARVTFREVFADRPQTDGQPPSRTEIACEDRSGAIIDCR